MLGKNPIARPRMTQDYNVHEIFPTIQGEGPSVGRPAVFVRLAGCNLRCWFCDTEFDNGTVMSEDALYERIVEEAAPSFRRARMLVVITGGEPLLQLKTSLCQRLLRAFDVQIESAGSVMPFDLPPGVGVVVSPKTLRVTPALLPYVIAWKYVISADNVHPVDGLPHASTQRRGAAAMLARPPKGADVYVQPLADVDPEITARNLQATINIARRHNYRLSLQTHKILNLP